MTSIRAEYLHNPSDSGRAGKRKSTGTRLKRSSYLIGRFYSPFSHRAQGTLFTPEILNNHCFQFLLGIPVDPREIEDNAWLYTPNFWG